ncbi:MAG: exonuclease domain-containing protein [Spirochaetia bacterium]
MNSNPVIVAFDVETTGLVAGVDRVVELAAVSFRGDEVLDAFSCLVNPEMPMPPAASRVTGITDELLAEAPPAADALPDFLCMLARGTPVAHNAVFDVGFVSVEAEAAGLPAPEGPVLDTRGLARHAFPGRFSYGLGNLARDLRLVTPGAHRALADAHACRQLFQACVERLAKDAELSIQDLIRLSGAPLDFCAHAPRQPQTARLLQQSLESGTMVDISYRSGDGALTSRTIKPLSFSLVGGNVAVVAFCTLRNSTRTFFLDSITEAKLSQ